MRQKSLSLSRNSSIIILLLTLGVEYIGLHISGGAGCFGPAPLEMVFPIIIIKYFNMGLPP